MNWIDGIIIIVIFLNAWRGFRRGLLWEVADILIIFLAYLSAKTLHRPVENFLIDKNVAPATAGILSYVIIFVAVYILLFLVVWIAQQLLKAMKLDTVNKIFGMLFAILKVIFVLSILLLVIVNYPQFGLADNIRNSLICPYILKGIREVYFILPSDYQVKISNFLDVNREIRPHPMEKR